MESDKIRLFFAKKGDEDGEKNFRNWKRNNREGYYINDRGKTNSMIHKADCHHSGCLAEGNKATNTRKICAREISDLRDWAKANAYKPLKSCSSCM